MSFARSMKRRRCNTKGVNLRQRCDQGISPLPRSLGFELLADPLSAPLGTPQRKLPSVWDHAAPHHQA